MLIPGHWRGRKLFFILRSFFSLFRFLAALKQGIKFGEEEKADFAQSWQRTSARIRRLMCRLAELPPYRTADTLSIFRARAILLAIALPVAHITTMLSKNAELLTARKAQITSGALTIEESKKTRMRPEWVTEVRDLGYPRTVCTQCGYTMRSEHREWKQTCHYHCYLEGVQGNRTEDPSSKDVRRLAETECAINAVILGGCTCTSPSNSIRNRYVGSKFAAFFLAIMKTITDTLWHNLLRAGLQVMVEDADVVAIIDQKMSEQKALEMLVKGLDENVRIQAGAENHT